MQGEDGEEGEVEVVGEGEEEGEGDGTPQYAAKESRPLTSSAVGGCKPTKLSATEIDEMRQMSLAVAKGVSASAEEGGGGACLTSATTRDVPEHHHLLRSQHQLTKPSVRVNTYGRGMPSHVLNRQEMRENK